MASSLLILLDDIAGVLDDVATMTKVAVQKTAGVIGDDLALNAKQVTGVVAARELPVVWAVARGSAINKAILVPVALLLGWLAPALVPPLLMVGGLYLCYEGAEKILHRALDRDAGHAPAAGHESDHRRHAGGHDERSKIAAAIRTDFILSAEIIVITLGVVAASPPVTRVAVLVAVAVAMTVGVYGLVAAIVKLDDVGAALASAAAPGARPIGLGILAAAPVLMRLLSVAGTVAMFLVGGGIVAHAVPAVHDAIHQGVASIAGDGPAWPAVLATAAAEGAVGLAAGGAALAAAHVGRRLWERFRRT
ncbi:MAG: DUF808 domain-containing protein [Planctomycetaceae bacterium]